MLTHFLLLLLHIKRLHLAFIVKQPQETMCLSPQLALTAIVHQKWTTEEEVILGIFVIQVTFCICNTFLFLAVFSQFATFFFFWFAFLFFLNVMCVVKLVKMFSSFAFCFVYLHVFCVAALRATTGLFFHPFQRQKLKEECKSLFVCSNINCKC